MSLESLAAGFNRFSHEGDRVPLVEVLRVMNYLPTTAPQNPRDQKLRDDVCRYAFNRVEEAARFRVVSYPFLSDGLQIEIAENADYRMRNWFSRNTALCTTVESMLMLARESNIQTLYEQIEKNPKGAPSIESF